MHASEANAREGGFRAFARYSRTLRSHLPAPPLAPARAARTIEGDRRCAAAYFFALAACSSHLLAQRHALDAPRFLLDGLSHVAVDLPHLGHLLVPLLGLLLLHRVLLGDLPAARLPLLEGRQAVERALLLQVLEALLVAVDGTGERALLGKVQLVRLLVLAVVH
jgi:hypothetical protein